MRPQIHSSGCGHAPPPSLTPGGPSTPFTLITTEPRTYLLSLPSAYDSSTPSLLILAFHGKGQTSAEFETQTQLSNPSFNTLNAIIAFPQGVDKMWTGDPEAPTREERDDISFVSTLISHLIKNYCIATSQIYIIGFSNGGGLAHILACDEEVSKRIAAVGIVSGAIYKDKSLKGHQVLFDKCEGGRVPVPLLEMHGTRDPVIHVDGVSTPDGETWAIEEWLEGWRVRNGCGEGREPTWEGHVHGGTVKKRSWFSGEGSETQEVLCHYYIEGFGHGWPNSVKQDDDGHRYGPVNWNATKDFMDFFASKYLLVELDEPVGKMRDEL